MDIEAGRCKENQKAHFSFSYLGKNDYDITLLGSDSTGCQEETEP